MKKIILLTLICLASLQLHAQTDGISYQAVIVGPNETELPGVDAQGNILPNSTVAIRFTILNANNSTEYQEIQTTNTDQYGRINLIIGSVDPNGFALISWDGTAKNLKVEIDFSGGGNSYVDMSRQELTFTPYAYHRNITATGTLSVDDATFLNGELIVQGPTILNSTLSVNKGDATNLSGLLNVTGKTDLKSSLIVGGITNLSDALNVNNEKPTYLSGDLTVGDPTDVEKVKATFDVAATFNGSTSFKGESEFTNLEVKGTATIDGNTTINGVTTVNNTAILNGVTTINDTAILNGPTTLNSLTTLKGQVKINANLDTNGNRKSYYAYPLLVEGSAQGIAIKVNSSRSSKNDYVSFWDNDGKMWGRIEGQTSDELNSDWEYQLGIGTRTWEIVTIAYDALKVGVEIGLAFGELAARSTASTACVGLGACVTVPPPTPIAMQLITIAAKIADAVVIVVRGGIAGGELAGYIATANLNVGVTYSSGSGDYAEWLPKQNTVDTFFAGELVGIKNGLVTKNLWGVEKIMIVSTNPIVLGNMPQLNNEKDNVKIAFMGQVPVKIIGNVKPGDYILPSEFGNGFGKAVHPEDMKSKDYKKVAGVAWSIIEELSKGISIVNAAVGINTNDLSDLVSKQEEEIKALQVVYDLLKIEMEQSNSVLANLVPGYAEATGITSNKKIIKVEKNIEHDIVYGDENDIIYFEISRTQIETAIDIAREQYQQMLNDSGQMKSIITGKDPQLTKGVKNSTPLSIQDHPFWQKIDNNTAYKEAIVNYIYSNLEKSFHTHKKYVHNFTHLEEKK